MTKDSKDKTYIYKAIEVVDILLLVYIIVVCLLFHYYNLTNQDYLIYNENTTYTGKPYSCYDMRDIYCTEIGKTVYPNEMYIKEVSPFLYYNMENYKEFILPVWLYVIFSRIYLFWRNKNATSSKN